MKGNNDGDDNVTFEEGDGGGDDDGNNNNNNERKKKRRKVEDVKTESTLQQQEQQHLLQQPSSCVLFDNNILSTVLKFSNVLDLENWKSVSKGFNELCTKAIDDKCDGKKKKKFETKQELYNTVRKYYKIKYEPLSYEGDETNHRKDAEDIACTYGWIINLWDVSKITNFSCMFHCCPLFNESIDKWDTSNAETMSCMFFNARSFNQDISGWNTSKVTDMDYMFWYATSFNQDISSWDTSRVTNMSYLFFRASSFDQPTIGCWDVSSITRPEGISGMFINTAESFNARQLPWFQEDMLLYY